MQTRPIYQAPLLLLVVLLMLSSCTGRGKRTRHFTLTEDSTFIGAWGGELQDEQTGYWPTLSKSFNLMYIYSKNNKIYVMHRPHYFDTDSAVEKESLIKMLTRYDSRPIADAFDTSYTVESETVISRQLDEDISDKYEILSNNNLAFYRNFKSSSGSNKLERYTFKPYYFKTIANPEDKK